ncbi:MAG: 2-amino-4-hydroxy-6-hydroxymethyldihydropteridine diphosphokinase [Pyrinomonadaceae bacterium]
MKPSAASPATHAYISLGSNLGDRAGNLLLAVRGLLEAGLVVSRLSSVYETEPVPVSGQHGPKDMPLFLNMAAELRTPLPPPEQLLAQLLRLEYSLGRTREIPGGPRTIDLDLLLCGDETRGTEFLTLPHPRLHQRRFVMVPLVELAPRLIHPTLQKSASDLLSETEDRSEVRLWLPSP